MVKFLYFLMIFPILLCSQSNSMIDLFSEVSMIEYYNDGEQFELTASQQEQFEELFCQALEGSRQMPAYGVSLHDLTIKSMQSGLWVKFIYNKTMIKSEMPFDSLLINITKDCHGINLIRGNDGIFEGRCYYLDLENTMDDVYDFLIDCTNKSDDQIEVELDYEEPQEVLIKEEESERPFEDKEGEDSGEGGKDPQPENSRSSNEILKHLQ